MRVAIASGNGRTVSRHYGRARHFLVLTIDDGRIVAREARLRPGALTSHPAGCSPEETTGHGRRAARIVADCDALIAGGMGPGAFEHLRHQGVTPVLTDVRDPDEAALRYAAGELPHLPERMHDRGVEV